MSYYGKVTNLNLREVLGMNGDVITGNGIPYTGMRIIANHKVLEITGLSRTIDMPMDAWDFTMRIL